MEVSEAGPAKTIVMDLIARGAIWAQKVHAVRYAHGFVKTARTPL